MALQTQTLELKMVGGLAEDVDPRVVPPGSWLGLDDVQIGKSGVWTKRFGFSPLGYPETLGTSEPLSARYEHTVFPWPKGVKLLDNVAAGVVGPTLYGVWCSSFTTRDAPVIATYQRGSPGSWEAKDTAPVFSLTRTSDVRSSRQITGGCSVEIDGVLWSAYKTDGERAQVYLRGVSLLTGAVVQDDVLWFELLGRYEQFVLLAVDGKPTAIYEYEAVS